MIKFNIAKAFADALKKNGVESVIKQKQTIQEEILGILDPSRKFRSISDKIKDMQERAGIFKLTGVKKATEEKEMFIKTFDKNIEVFDKYPNLKKLIMKYLEENYAKDEPAIISDIKRLVEAFAKQKNEKINPMTLLSDDNFKEFISVLLSKIKKSKDISFDSELDNLLEEPEVTTEDEQLNNDVFSGAQKN